jgi:glycosyltransferase involved in cell wall biosynthesis
VVLNAGETPMLLAMNFTIITPSLNYGRFLGDCLESVAAQMEASKERRNPSADAHVDPLRGAKHCELNLHGQGGSETASPCVSLEHLVIDGGSTDESARVAAGFPGVTWIQESDQGMSDAINKGFDRATGDWVMWLNADDRLKPGALARMIQYLGKSDADVVYGDWDFVDESGKFMRHVTSPKWSMFVHVHHHCFVGSTSAFYRRQSVVDQGHRLRKDFRYVMDGEFYARLHAVGKRFEHVPVNVADFRLHGANASQRHLGKTRDMETILAAEKQHVESRAIRRAYGVTLFEDPYLNGWVDGVLWVIAKGWKKVLRCFSTSVGR